MTIKVYLPESEPGPEMARRATSPTSLAGLRIAVLDNGKPNAGFLMLAVAERLRASYGVTEIVKREKPVAGPPSPQALEDLARCDFALVGSSD